MATEVRIRQDTVAGWRGYRMEAGELTLGIVPQIGGRIMSLTHKGEELFFVQEQYRGQSIDLSKIQDLAKEKKRLGFRVWGGDKTWVSPEEEWLEKTPPLDLDSGAYSCEVKDKKIEMVSPVCRETGLRIIRQVELKDERTVILNQTLINESSQVQKRGIWNVTQLRRPWDVIWPATKDKVTPVHDEGLKENADYKVTELFYSSALKEGLTKIACDDRTHFKFRAFISRGAVIALKRSKKGLISFTRHFDINFDEDYPHNDTVVEVYNARDYEYLEIEVHGPLVELKPQGKVQHKQTWQIKRLASEKDALDIQKILSVK